MKKLMENLIPILIIQPTVLKILELNVLIYYA